MLRRSLVILCAIFLLAGGTTYLFWPRGHQSISITDVSEPFSASVSSSGPIPASGSMYAIVEGELDGDAMLDVVSNHGRDRRELSLTRGHISLFEGGAEEWVDDLQIHYRPTTAKHGQLYVALYCGTGLNPDDYARVLRIERNRH